MRLNEKQTELLESLGVPASYEALKRIAERDSDEYLRYYEAIEDSMLYKGVNDAGDGLNEYGELCHSILVAVADI